MVNNVDENNEVKSGKTSVTWQLNALTEALGDLTLSVEDSLSIGRGNDNDVVLGSKSVSRNHALLSVLNDQLYIKDLDSSNGTFINDERIESNKSTHLNASDTVGFASFVFKVATPTTAQTATQDLTSVPKTPVQTESVVSAAASPVEPAAEESTVMDRVDSIDSLDSVETQSTHEKVVDEPVVKETIIGKVLSSNDSEIADAPVATEVESNLQPTSAPNMVTEKEAEMSDDKSKETLKQEPTVTDPIVKEPVVEEPKAKQSIAAHQQSEPFVDEHDKTTKTTLQEEADPDVLRAKQAATAQFSGTANLGQGRDLGTEGNNAMDQAIDNPANEGQTEKKPSGGWFIWVFIVVIIIGVALWLFNMGGA